MGKKKKMPVTGAFFSEGDLEEVSNKLLKAANK